MGGACFDAVIGMAVSLSTDVAQLIQAGCKFFFQQCLLQGMLRSFRLHNASPATADGYAGDVARK
jgi:hypothetical protein